MTDKIRSIVKNIMPNKELKLSDDADLIDDLGFDSIAMIALVSSLEEECGITFDDEELDLSNFKNISTISRVLEEGSDE